MVTYKQQLVDLAAEIFGVHPRDLMGKYRFGFITRPRFALYKALHLRGWSYSAIGRFMDRDHSTIIYGVERADYLMERDQMFADCVKLIAEKGIETSGAEKEAA